MPAWKRPSRYSPKPEVSPGLWASGGRSAATRVKRTAGRGRARIGRRYPPPPERSRRGDGSAQREMTEHAHLRSRTNPDEVQSWGKGRSHRDGHLLRSSSLAAGAPYTPSANVEHVDLDARPVSSPDAERRTDSGDQPSVE